MSAIITVGGDPSRDIVGGIICVYDCVRGPLTCLHNMGWCRFHCFFQRLCCFEAVEQWSGLSSKNLSWSDFTFPFGNSPCLYRSTKTMLRRSRNVVWISVFFIQFSQGLLQTDFISTSKKSWLFSCAELYLSGCWMSPQSLKILSQSQLEKS